MNRINRRTLYTALVVSFGFMVLACRAPKSLYGPVSDNASTAPGGRPAAVYEVPHGQGNGGQVQVWTEGIMDDGRRARSIRVGLIARNDSRVPLAVRATDIQLLIDEETKIRPNETNTTTVNPGLSTEILFNFLVPPNHLERAPDAFRVAWAVHFGTATYRNETTFSRDQSGFVPKPLETSEPIDRDYLEGENQPPPVGIPFGK